MPKAPTLFPEDENYPALLDGLKKQIRTAQVRTALAVNKELILLYWQSSRELLVKLQQQGWRSKVIERLSKDLKQEFPKITGFSLTNLKHMRAFAEAYTEEEISQRCVDQLSWRHNIALLEKLTVREERLWYARNLWKMVGTGTYPESVITCS